MAHNEDGSQVDSTAAEESENAAALSDEKTSSTLDSKESASDDAVEKESADTNDESDFDDLSLEEVQNILNKTADSKDLPRNVQRLLNREQESSKRVEEAVKKTKSNPRWFVPLFSFLLVLGLVWVVVNYITSGVYPIPGIGNWNLAIGFAIMMLGFLMTMWWH